MKKLIITIAILLFVSSAFSQVITKKYQKIQGMNFSNPTYLFVIDSTKLYKVSKTLYDEKNVGDVIDLTGLQYEGKINLNSQGNSDSLSNEQKEILYYVQELQKLEKQSAEIEKAKIELNAIIQYVSRKYNINLQELLKK